MINYDIKRGVGKEVEIFGLSEKYVYYLVGCLLPGFIGFAIGRMVMGAWIGFIVLCTIMYGAYLYFSSLTIRHGTHGVAKLSAYSKRPRIVTVNSRAVFLNLKDECNGNG